jgi:hypothetical protein
VEEAVDLVVRQRDHDVAISVDPLGDLDHELPRHDRGPAPAVGVVADLQLGQPGQLPFEPADLEGVTESGGRDERR